MNKVKEFGEAMKAVPQDCWAVVLLMIGCGMTLAGQKDEGMLVVGAALAIFKGQAQAQ